MKIPNSPVITGSQQLLNSNTPTGRGTMSSSTPPGSPPQFAINPTQLRNSMGSLTSTAYQKVLRDVEENKLEVANFRNLELGDKGLKTLLDQLGRIKWVKVIQLSGNSLTKEGVLTLCKFFRVPSSIQWVGLSKNIIGQDGEEALRNIQNPNSTDVLINLTENDCESDFLTLSVVPTIERMINFINNNYDSVVETVSFKGIGIGDTDLPGIVEAIMNNGNVRNVDLSENGITKKGLKLLKPLFGRQDLLSVNLSGNVLGISEAKIIAKWVKGLEILVKLENTNLNDKGKKWLQKNAPNISFSES